MEKEVVSYDYKTIRVKRQMETMTTDAYEALGWVMVGSSISEGGIFHVNLSFKRDRKIANKQNLLKLQEKVDTTLLSIDELQNKKKSAGQVPALSTGIVGALTLGGGMAMVMELGIDAVGFMIGGIALGVVGIGICALAWLVYKKVKRNRINRIDPLLESEFNKLADLCEEAKSK